MRVHSCGVISAPPGWHCLSDWLEPLPLLLKLLIAERKLRLVPVVERERLRQRKHVFRTLVAR